MAWSTSMAHEHQSQPIVENQLALAESVIALARGLVGEMNVRQSIRVTLDSKLESDLGLGSLARMELLSRVERQLGVGISEQAITTAETLRDVVRAVHRQVPSRIITSGSVLPKEPLLTAEPIPDKAQTLQTVLTWHVENHPERTHIHLLTDEENYPILTYEQLWEGAEEIAAGLQHLGIQPGDAVAIMLPTGSEYFFSFFAILLAGAIPVPIYPPLRRSQLEEHLRRHRGILSNCNARVLITISRAKVFAQLLKSQVPSLQHVATKDDLATLEGSYQSPNIEPDDIAFLQYTSGSTGSPKGVILTHSNLLANIRAMGEAVSANARDVFVSWLPLYHDMGLIGAWLASMYFSATLVSM